MDSFPSVRYEISCVIVEGWLGPGYRRKLKEVLYRRGEARVAIINAFLEDGPALEACRSAQRNTSDMFTMGFVPCI